ncbi:MAG: hypothetical protein ACTHNK_09680 [Thermomicrobiales bacterium]
MSMMIRRGAAGANAGVGQGAEAGAADATAELRFPESPGVTPVFWPLAEVRQRVVELGGRHFTGYLTLRRGGRGNVTEGVVLFQAGRPVGARAGVVYAGAALSRLVATEGAGEAQCAMHTLNDGVTLALLSTFHPPQLTQPMGADGGEVALLLRDLAGVRHSGVVQISATDAPGLPLWVRIIMYEGKFLGVYSGGDRRLKPSLADVNTVLTEATPQLTLFATQGAPQPLVLPEPARATLVQPAPAPVPGASPERDELLETDLVWFLSRFERAFGRLKDRRDPHADLLRAFGELTNEIASFVAALHRGENASAAEAQAVVANELARARVAGALGVDLRLGKAGLDAVAVAKAFTAFPKRSQAALEYFQAASAAMLVLMERLMGHMLAAFYDATSAGFAREGCETLLREVRSGLADFATA